MFIIVYLIISAALTSLYYYMRITDFMYVEDHCLDVVISLLVGVFFPVTALFAFPVAVISHYVEGSKW